MRQPENNNTKQLGNEGSVGNDAEIIGKDEYNGPAEQVQRIAVWYCKDEVGLFSSFEDSVRRTAKALAESYVYWPEGYVHVQTIINDEYVNII